MINRKISFLNLIQDNTPAAVPIQQNAHDGSQVEKVVVLEDSDMKVTVERELVSQAEEDEMEALLGTYVFSFFVLSL